MRRLVVMIAVVAVAALGSGIAIGATTGATLLCYDTKTGVVRADVTGGGCLKRESEVVTRGGGGTGGTGLEVERIVAEGTAPAQEIGDAFAGCPVGEVVLGGGYETQSINTALRPFTNAPVEADGVQGWQVAIINETDAAVTFHAFALCAPGTAAGY